jgi:hypothetical protein
MFVNNVCKKLASFVRGLTLICTAWELKKMFEAKYFLKIKNASQKILTNFFVSEVIIKNVIFSMLLMIIQV